MTGKLSPEQQEEFDRYATDALSKMRRKRIPVEDALREASIALVRAGRAAPGEGIDSESAALNVLRQTIKDERDEAVQEIAEHHNKARAEIARLSAETAAHKHVASNLTAELAAEQDKRSDVIRERNEAEERARGAEAGNRALRAEIARLTAELAAARAVPAEVEVAIGLVDAIVEHARTLDSYDWQSRLDDSRTSDDAKDDARELSHALRDYDRSNGSTFLRTTIARAISDATAAGGTVGGLLAAAPVVEYQVDLGRGPRWRQTRHGRTRTWLGSSPVGMSWTEWSVGSDDVDEYAARLVPAAEADADPSQRGPLPKGG